jgi:hypothetical protein
MKSVYIILSFSSIALGQYSITDLIGSNDAGNSAVAPVQQSPAIAGDSQIFPNTGPTAKNVRAPQANPAGKMMTSILSGHAFRASTGGVLSQDSMAVVSGLVESFMHKVKLEPGESACLENNVRVASGDIMGTVGDIVTAVKSIMAGKAAVKQAAGNLISAGIDSAMKITSLVSSSMQLIKNCVHGDALVFLNMTAQHLMNGTYLEDRFIVNGVNIFHSLSDSIVAFEAQDFHRFGADIGVALRKILLSSNTNATRLPEGVPKQEIIQKTTDGLMKGFFVRGSLVQVTDKSHPDVNIVVDLHQCIAGNSPFFKELWLAAWNLVAQLSMNGEQHGFGVHQPQRSPQRGPPKWQGELMVAMMQLPTALSNCGVSQDIQTMFTEAIESLRDIDIRIRFPHGTFNPNAEADEMAKAVEAWTNWNFEDFGYELGKLLRELVFLAFPQKYSFDASGKLRRYSGPVEIADTPVKKWLMSSATLGVGGAVSFVIALALVRARRSSYRHGTEAGTLVPESDVESHGNDEFVE